MEIFLQVTQVSRNNSIIRSLTFENQKSKNEMLPKLQLMKKAARKQSLRKFSMIKPHIKLIQRQENALIITDHYLMY